MRLKTDKAGGGGGGSMRLLDLLRIVEGAGSGSMFSQLSGLVVKVALLVCFKYISGRSWRRIELEVDIEAVVQ